MTHPDPTPSRVRFLPAVLVPVPVLLRLVAALDEAAGLLPPGSLPAAAFAAARTELMRHRGGSLEACILSRDAVFGVGDLLDEAGRLAAECGSEAAVLVAFGVADRLVDHITELQPVAST